MAGIVLVAVSGRGMLKATAIQEAADRVGLACTAVEVGNTDVVEFERTLELHNPSIVVPVEPSAQTAVFTELAAQRGYVVALVDAGGLGLPRSALDAGSVRSALEYASHVLAATSEAAEAVVRDGFPAERVTVTGSAIVEAISMKESGIDLPFGLRASEYAVITLHRDDVLNEPPRLAGILEAAVLVARCVPVVLSLHRVPDNRFAIRLLEQAANPDLIVCPTLPYPDFIDLLSRAAFVITDVAGVAEEAIALRIRWLMLCTSVVDDSYRSSTVAVDPEQIVERALTILEGSKWQVDAPELWDGQASDRIVDYLKQDLAGESPRQQESVESFAGVGKAAP